MMILLALVLAVGLSSMQWTEKEALVATRTDYLDRLDRLVVESKKLENLVREDLGKVEQQNTVLRQFHRCRRAFKKVEWLMEYWQPQDVKDYLNGAPLPKTERAVPRVITVEPKGLQRIEELVYGSWSKEEQKELRKLSREMQSDLLGLRAYQQRMPVYDRHILEAARMAVVRVLSMGLTGFDTPASDSALSESALSLESVREAILRYEQRCTDKELMIQIEAHFSAAINVLESSSFEALDRSELIRAHLEPLYRDLGRLHRELKVETMAEVSAGEYAWNYSGDHIFSDDFLNPYYYTELYAELDNPALRKLGRKLFYDRRLSKQGALACASCHRPELAFADGRAKSKAGDGSGELTRNAPTLWNAIYSDRFFYDLRATTLEKQMEHVIFNAREFDHNYQGIMQGLRKDSLYPQLFEKAFAGQSNQGISRYTFSMALSSYLVSLRGFNSPVDRYLRGEEVQLAPEVLQGFNLFMGKASCGTCHFAPTFSGLVPPLYTENESEVLGVLVAPESNALDPDLGRWASGTLADEAVFYKHSFKTVTVRNVALTAPYFHNGAYGTLEEVVNFYNHGGAQGKGLELPYQTLPADSLQLNESERLALEAFMVALTDTSTMY